MHGIDPASVLAVASTGSMVCVAGTSLMSKLQVRTDELRDVADMQVECLGYTTCHNSSGDWSAK